MGPSTDERLVEELLGLSPEGPLNDDGKPPPEFLGLLGYHLPARVVSAEDILEDWFRTQQRAGAVDVLHQPPEFGQ